MNKSTLASILEHHDELSRLWRQVADDKCREGSAWEVYDAMKRSMQHDREVRTLRTRYVNVEA